MTQKEIMAIATNPAALEILAEIAKEEEFKMWTPESEEKAINARVKELVEELKEEIR